jgi:hypothetical protein
MHLPFVEPSVVPCIVEVLLTLLFALAGEALWPRRI